MKFLDKADDELIGTLNLMSHFPAKTDQLQQEMKQFYLNNPNDPKAAFAFGLYQMIRISNVDPVLSTQNVDSIFEAYNHALKLNPNYWLVHMFKSIILLSLPPLIRNDDDLIKTLDILIQQQNEVEHKEPYFIVPYICYADYIYDSKQDKQKVLDILCEGEQSAPGGSIQFPNINKYLTIPFVSFTKRLKQSNDYDIESRVRQLRKIYFSDEKAS
jgi:hypothetical protein